MHTRNLVNSFNMGSTKLKLPSDSPTSVDEQDYVARYTYRTAIGGLMCLMTCTQADLAYLKYVNNVLFSTISS